MKLKRVPVIVGGVVVLALVWVGVTRWALPEREQAVESRRAASGERRVAVSAGLPESAVRDVPSAAKPPRFPRAGAQARPPKEKAGGAVAPIPAAGSPEGGQVASKTEREKAVEVWDGFIEEVAERTGVPTVEEAARFKDEFHKLDAADRMDGIQNALNLLPDGQFSLVYPILFDKTENADILDEIFSDALNRDEEIKVPIMKEIYKDKEHPMFVESARILDATGELDEMNGAGEKDAEDDTAE